MNGDDLPVAHGGPLRLRIPRQLGYKNVKFITQLTVTDSMKRFGKSVGGVNPEFSYAWYAGVCPASLHYFATVHPLMSDSNVVNLIRRIGFGDLMNRALCRAQGY
jgi:DMSO/TMAO reductase YedYZ molybdopterin-dependent catalytic subunit